MRDGRNVGDHGDFQIACAQRADGGFSACAGALHENFDAAKAVFFCRFRRRFARCCAANGVSLSGTFETEATRARPGDRVAAHIGNGNQSIVERGLDVNLTFINFFKLLRLLVAVAFFVAAAIYVVLLRLFLLLRNGTTGTFPRSRVSLGTLASHGQSLSVADSAIAADLHQSFDIQVHFSAKFALHS